MKPLTAFLIALLVFVLSATPVFAIVFGEPDGNAHPFVGVLVLRQADGSVSRWCSGTLIAERVFLTASHCTFDLDEVLAELPGAQFLVTFDPVISETGTFFTGAWYTNPNYNDFQGQLGHADPGDVAVIVLNHAPGIAPARLPPAGLLDELKASHTLRDTRFMAVGYGRVRDSFRGGLDGILDNRERRRAEQGYWGLTPHWLNLSMNPNTGNGGTCYGDSGGPHFIYFNGQETNIIASITVTGDIPCKSAEISYRMDTESVRAFLASFVTLP
jgi:hypothetical protein